MFQFTWVVQLKPLGFHKNAECGLRSADTENAESQNADTQNADSQNAESQNADR